MGTALIFELRTVFVFVVVGSGSPPKNPQNFRSAKLGEGGNFCQTYELDFFVA